MLWEGNLFTSGFPSEDDEVMMGVMMVMISKDLVFVFSFLREAHPACRWS